MTTRSSATLSPRERAALTIIAGARPHGDVTGIYLTRQMINRYGLGTSPAGAHRTAASLVRKGLAERLVPNRAVLYRITRAGTDRLNRETR